MHKRTWTVIGLGLLAVAILIPVFLHLDYCGIYRWDESRNAMNALEMSEGGNPLVRTIFGQPDHWETKPPLLIWLQVVFIKLLGPNELAIRLPNAISGIALAVLILGFFKKYLNDLKAGIFSVLILFTANGYVRPHVLRSGEHDAILILWLIMGLLAYFIFLERSGKGQDREDENRYLLWTGISITLAVLTKSITGLFFIPGMLLFTVIMSKLNVLFKSKWLYISIGVFILLVGGYYLGRTIYDPDYLYWVNENELFKRYFNTSTEFGYDERGIWFYFHLLKDIHFHIWFWALPLTLIPLISSKNPANRRFTAYIMLNSLLFFIIISKGTANDWYDAPIIPLLSILLGLTFSRMYDLTSIWMKLPNIKNSIPVIIATSLVVFSYPYYSTIKSQVYRPMPSNSDMAYGNFLRVIKSNMPDTKVFSIISECNNAHTDFYVKVYNDYKDYELTNWFTCNDDLEDEIHGLRSEAEYMVCSEPFKSIIDEWWNYEVLAEDSGCRLITLKSLK